MIRLRGRDILIMGILNVTDDSFSDGGLYSDSEKAVSRALEMISQGADIIDIGGESTRPGFTAVSVEEEISRVVPVIRALRKETDITISVDTYKYEVAKAAVEAGADIINDVSCLADRRLAALSASSGKKIVIMYNRRGNGDAPSPEQDDGISADLKEKLEKACAEAASEGVPKEDIILDPGVGFGTTRAQDIDLIKSIASLRDTGYPVLLGLSRKRVIGSILPYETAPDQRDDASAGAALAGILYGADIVRVHDVKKTFEMLKGFSAAYGEDD